VEGSEALRRPLVDMFGIEFQVERVRVTPLCVICRKNQGWPEPRSSLWGRAWAGLQWAWAKIRKQR